MIILIYNHIRCRSHTCANSGECGAGFVCPHFRCGKKVEKPSIHKQDSCKYSISGNANPSFGLNRWTVTAEPEFCHLPEMFFSGPNPLRNPPNSINSPGCGKAAVECRNGLFHREDRTVPDEVIHSGDHCEQDHDTRQDHNRPGRSRHRPRD